LLPAFGRCGSAGALASRVTAAEARFVIGETVALDLGIGSPNPAVTPAGCGVDGSGVATGAVVAADVLDAPGVFTGVALADGVAA
jgi:hypothetical protein